MSISRLAYLVAALLLTINQMARAEVRSFTGPIGNRGMLAFHVVNQQGVDFSIHLKWFDDYQPQMDRPLLVRVLDPDERQILRHDDPGMKTSGAATWHDQDLSIKAAGPGVYQVIVNGFGGQVEFSTNPPLPWGVYGYPELVATGDQFGEAFIFVPPNAPSLGVQSQGQVTRLLVADEAGAPKLDLAGPSAAGSVTVAGDAGKVWGFSAKAAEPAALSFRGWPVILCPDADTARAIHGSVDVLDDGTICYHRFQARIQQILKVYRSLTADDFKVTTPVLVREKAAWLADPARNALLLGPYGVYSALPMVLSAQNLDPKSPWFGTINADRDEADKPRLLNPWTTYDRLGLSRAAEPVTVLAAVYSIDEPFNRLRQSKPLLNRIIIASLQELMLLREHEHPLPEFTGYQGGDRAFELDKFTQSFPLVIKDCPPQVQQVWTEGLRRWVDAMTISQVASVVNQWTFIMRGLQQFADGCDDPWYDAILQRHLRWMYDRTFWNVGQAEAGYFHEAEGPDATYVGMSLHNLAWIHEQTKDAALLDSLRKCFVLFNHTIAPEPDGSLLGASNFSHRTPGDWTNPQYGAGVGMLADDLPEAAAMAGRAWMSTSPPRDAAQLKSQEQNLLESFKYLDFNAMKNPNIGPAVIASGPDIHFCVWQHFAGQFNPAPLPVTRETRFTREFGKEFFCVRRPGYYAFLYAGRPQSEPNKAYRPQEASKQHQRNGGGLSMFWSPQFGSSLLSKNWSAYAANCIVAESDQRTDWEDYWSVTSAFDTDAGKAVINCRLRDQPITISREYQFDDGGVECRLTIKAESDTTFKAMLESFPYPLDKPGKMTVTFLNERGQVTRDGLAQAILFSSDAPEAHLVIFDRARECSWGVDLSLDAYGKSREHGRVLSGLPPKWTAGQQFRTAWRMMPVPAGGAAEAIRAAIDRFNKPG